MPYFRHRRGTSVAALSLSLALLAGTLAVTPAAAGEVHADQSPEEEAPGALICTSGFGQVASKADMSLHGVTLTSRGALAVGYARSRSGGDLGRRRPASVVHRSGDWTRIYTGSPGAEDGLIAVDSRDGGPAWAVGFTTIEGRVMPLAMRWNGRKWVTNRPRSRSKLTSLFTDVAIVGDGRPMAIGYRMTASGKRRPISARLDRGVWRNLPVRTGPSESITLTGIASDGRDGYWAVGHGGQGAEVKPFILKRDDRRWTRQRVPRLKGEAVLADVVASGPRESWAVGYQRKDRHFEPLVMRWNGQAWRRATPPDFGALDVQLSAVSAPDTGGIWVVGAAWNDDIDSHEAVAAWWDGQTWNEISGRDGGTELNDVIGSLADDGWAVGRSGPSARTARACIPPQAGIFGAPDPSVDAVAATDVPVDDDTDIVSAETRVEPEAAAGTSLLAVQGANKAVKAAAMQKAKQRAKQRAVAKRQAARQRARQERRRAARLLPTARLDASIIARSVARKAGIAEQTGTYDAVIADFDADGDDDMFIGRHGRRGRLVLNDGGIFSDHPTLRLPAVDRHGCTASDIDGSGLPDLYCAIGGKRGSGLKANELWIDPGGDQPVDVAVERGVGDPTGRGRQSVFLDAAEQHDTSLIVTNSPVRVDGLPSIGRHYQTTGDGQFKARGRPGFAPRLGALALQDADFDGDGREDLLLVTGGNQSPVQQGTRLYRNTRRGLVDVTKAMGIRSFAEVDAELVDLDGDGSLDLVQLSPGKIRVSTLKQGKFRKVWERNLSHGRGVATGDVNGDGKGDIYVVRGNGERNSPDVMLINRNGGAKWTSMIIPQVYTGSGEDAYAIDHDGNGLDDFLVLNGHNQRGPLQLIAFYERQDVARS